MLSLLLALALLNTTLAQQPGAAALQPTKNGYAPVNGQKIYYEMYGAGSPLVLLHGAYMTIQLNWAPMLPELAKNHTVIALEMQGHGHTPLTNRPLSIDSIADDVSKTLAFLNVPKADIVGYSFGGIIAYKLAIDYPLQVNKVVIISSAWKYDGWQTEVRQVFHMMRPEFLSNTPLKQAYKAVAPDTANWLPFVKQMIVMDTTSYNLGESKVKSIKAPVLLISGDNDGVDKHILFDTYRMLGGGVFADMAPMPKSRLAIIPGQGHVTVMMQTDALLKLINGFL